ncbi:hypothetical protein VOLCADRAFT_105577, partial [Volvox carteri f. nagariensis]
MAAVPSSRNRSLGAQVTSGRSALLVLTLAAVLLAVTAITSPAITSPAIASAAITAPAITALIKPATTAPVSTPSTPKQGTPSPPPPTPPPEGGLRLVRGKAGNVGRLEVQLTYPDEWVALCDDGTFTAYEAGVGYYMHMYAIMRCSSCSPAGALPPLPPFLPITWCLYSVLDAYAFRWLLFCKMLGYSYGRQFYAQGISTYGPDESDPPELRGNLVCTGDNDSWPPYAFVVQEINFTSQQEVSCQAFHVACPRNMLVAMECSKTPFKYNGPPPPPSIPSPPPPPPPPPNMQDLIRLIRLTDSAPWAPDGLVVLLVNSADGGEPVWAPLCADGIAEVDTIANMLCKQNDGFRDSPIRTIIGSAWEAIEITQASTISDFNPSEYSHWVTVVGGISSSAYTVYDTQLQ